ncbi:MAG: carbohydrate-binding protein, partial [Ilumatobacteraceae bacterium]|nr:carbohydrate-binding protein [Ilumatobacteraceae bacterium]
AAPAPATTAGAAGGTAGAAATSPESAASGARKKIAFSHPFSTAPVAIAVMQFAKQRANELGYDLLLDNANNQVETQVTDLDTWVTQGVDAICVLPVEPQSVLGTQKRAQEAGIKWTTYAVTMDGSDGQVLFPHELSGKVIGEAAVAWINAQPSPPKILVLTSSKTPASAARTSVPLDLVKAQTKGDVVAQQDAVDQPSGLSVTETVLQAHPDLRCVIGFNDDGALGALQAFKNAGIPVDESWIGGQDGSIEALEAIKSGGYFKACAALPLKDIGYAVADINDQLLKGTSKFAEVSIDPELASPDQMDTVDELIAAYPK